MKTINIIISMTMLLILTVSPIQAETETSESLEGIKKGTTIYIGIETNGDWPPYEFYERKDGVISKKVIGYNIDILNEIFAKHGLKFEFKEFPWKRVLSFLKSGEEIQMILPTSVNDERKENYLISKQVYSITPSYFYLKEKYPDGLSISTSNDLLQHPPVCGKFGYNYKNFDIDEKTMDKGAKDFKALITKLKSERCNIVLARYEILAGRSLIGEPLLNDDIGVSPIPNVKGEPFHFMISKKYEYGTELMQIINNGIEKLKSEGKLEVILKKYIK